MFITKTNVEKKIQKRPLRWNVTTRYNSCKYFIQNVCFSIIVIISHQFLYKTGSLTFRKSWIFGFGFFLVISQVVLKNVTIS